MAEIIVIVGSILTLIFSIWLIVAIIGTHAVAKDILIQAKKANVYLENAALRPGRGDPE